MLYANATTTIQRHILKAPTRIIALSSWFWNCGHSAKLPKYETDGQPVVREKSKFCVRGTLQNLYWSCWACTRRRRQRFWALRWWCGFLDCWRWLPSPAGLPAPSLQALYICCSPGGRRRAVAGWSFPTPITTHQHR